MHLTSHKTPKNCGSQSLHHKPQTTCEWPIKPHYLLWIVQRSLLPNVQFPLSSHPTLVIRNEPILIYYNYSKSLIYSEAPIIYLMSLFCFRVLSRMLHYSLLMSQLLLVVKVSQTILNFDDFDILGKYKSYIL